MKLYNEIISIYLIIGIVIATVYVRLTEGSAGILALFATFSILALPFILGNMKDKIKSNKHITKYY